MEEDQDMLIACVEDLRAIIDKDGKDCKHISRLQKLFHFFIRRRWRHLKRGIREVCR